jgi:hypothetical protein
LTQIFGQENGRTTHFHLGDLIVGNTMGLRQERVKWEEWKSSTNMFEPPWEKRGGTSFREVWVESSLQ